MPLLTPNHIVCRPSDRCGQPQSCDCPCLLEFQANRPRTRAPERAAQCLKRSCRSETRYLSWGLELCWSGQYSMAEPSNVPVLYRCAGSPLQRIGAVSVRIPAIEPSQSGSVIEPWGNDLETEWNPNMRNRKNAQTNFMRSGFVVSEHTAAILRYTAPGRLRLARTLSALQGQAPAVLPNEPKAGSGKKRGI